MKKDTKGLFALEISRIFFIPVFLYAGFLAIILTKLNKTLSYLIQKSEKEPLSVIRNTYDYWLPKNLGTGGAGDAFIFLIIAGCIIISILLFNSEKKHENCWQFELFNFSRTKRYIIKYVTGFLCILLFFAAVTITMLIFMNNSKEYVFSGRLLAYKWILLNFLISWMAYSFSFFMQIVCGRPVWSGVITAVSMAVPYVSALYIESFFYAHYSNTGYFTGKSPISENTAKMINKVMDWFYMLRKKLDITHFTQGRNVYINIPCQGEDSITKITYDYVHLFFSYKVIVLISLAFLFTAAGLILYKRYKAEKAGRLIMFNWVKIVFVACFTVMAGLVGGYAANGDYKGADLFLMYLIASGAAVIGFFVSSMIVKKT